MSTTGSSSSSSDEDCIIVDVPYEPVQGMSEREPSPLAPWVSIIANESQNMMDEDSSSDEERDVAEVLATLSTVSTSSTKNASYKQHHILQILARQAIATDRQRRELEHLREEYNQELSRKTTQLRYTEAQLYTARDERDKLFSSLERMRAEMSSMRQRGAAPGSIPLDEHRKLLKRVEDMAKNRTAIIEGEKGELVFHMSKLRIELAQLRNQLEEQRFPDDMEAVLTDRVLQAVRSSCIDILNEVEEAKKAKAAVEEEMARVRREIQRAHASRADVVERCEQLEAELEDLNSEYDASQVQLAKGDARIDELREDLENAESHVQDLGARLAALERERDIAVMDAEQLRATSVESAHAVQEAEERREELEQEVERLKQTLAEMKARISDLSVGIDSNESIAIERKPVTAEAAVDATTKQLVDRSELEALTIKLREVELERDQYQEGARKVEDAKRDLNEALKNTGLELAKAKQTEFSLHVKLHDAEQRVREIELKQSDTEAQLQQSQSESKSLAISLEESEISARQLRKTHDDVLREVSTIKDELQGWQKGIQEGRKKMEAATQAATEFERRNKELETELGEKTGLAKRLEEELQSKGAELQSCREQIGQLTSEQSNLRMFVSLAEAKCTSLKDVVDGLKADLTQSENSRKELESKKEALSVAIKESEARANLATEQKSILEQRFAELNAVVSEHDRIFKNMQEEKTKVDGERQAGEKSLAQLREELGQTHVKLQEVEEVSKKHLKKIEELDGLYTAAKAAEEAAEKNLKLIRSELEAAKNRVTELTNTLDESASKKCAELEAQLSEAVKAKSAAEGRLAEVEHNSKQLEASAYSKALVEARNSLRNEAATWENEKQKLKDSLSAADKQILKLESARQRMAAIYGIPMHSPLPSPDRPYQPHFTHSHSSPPPGVLSPHSAVPFSSQSPQDLQAPSRKRPRISRSSTLGTGLMDEMEYIDSPMTLSIAIDGSRSASPATPVSLATRMQLQGQSTSISIQPDHRRSESISSSGASPADVPTGAELSRQLSLFAKLASWTTAEGLKYCGFCQLENHKDKPLTFDPIATPSELLRHCRTTHKAFCSPIVNALNLEPEPSRAMPTRRSQRVQKRGSEVAPPVNPNPQSSKRKGKAAASSQSSTAFLSTSTSVMEAQRELTESFTKMSAWRHVDGSFRCGLCELETTKDERHLLRPLQFDPFVSPDLFIGHCRQQHPEFWMPEIRASVEMIPSSILC